VVILIWFESFDCEKYHPVQAWLQEWEWARLGELFRKFTPDLIKKSRTQIPLKTNQAHQNEFGWIWDNLLGWWISMVFYTSNGMLF